MPQHSLWAISLTILLPIFGYLLGSISAAIVVARLLRLPDPRQAGSGNPGATNVLRLGGKRAAALTLAGDLVKGVVPVALARFLGLEGWALAAVALATFLGHLYPIYFGFRGGKGVATALGILLALQPLLGGAVLLVWVLIFLLTRLSSLAALGAALAAPILGLVLLQQRGEQALLLILALLVLWRHRGNIARLRSGAERPFRRS
ncbi:glycerol-3-phosphate 1-O-acyltransferase PlsY [Acidithiobacillus sulfuriphilus]|uniref:Glycerol-3-phosphate acyltransferase n=2 Tax=Acidithiobacillus sulfuriphilus TaxID=1867749 RepID=A0A3M8QXK0_9PROT|nr:glycerol-3-phosphate 1-O-acyltransferase PlsY [Acidithiobacillus sulfuriphilus]RNF61048.1 glycerol-3-phosphate 1-O-acyltransferase [Acidithiobacillus sulfuriphilus]